MGTVLAVGGWVLFDDASAKEAWKSKLVAAAKLTGWDEPLAPLDEPTAFDKLTIGALWENAHDAPEPIEIAETETGLRFAAALASVTGREVWAPSFLAAIRRAAGSARGGAWAFSADEGGSVLSVDLTKRGSFRRLDEGEEVEAALSEPELLRAFALNSGDAPPPTLAELPSREAGSFDGAANAKAKGRTAKAKTTTKAPAKDPPIVAKPAPRLKKINTKAKDGIRGAVRLPSGDVAMVGLFGLWVRGNVDTNTWTQRPLGLGKLWWIATEGARIWLGADAGLFVSDDDGATFVNAQPSGVGWSRPLFVEGAALICSGGALVRSTDGGKTWDQASSLEAAFVSLARGTGPHANRIVAAGIRGRIAVSDDLGQTFTMVRDGNDEAFNEVAIDGDDVYVVGSTRIFRAPITSPGDLVDVGPLPKKHCDFYRVFAAEGFVWVTCPERLLRSRDRGATWEIIAEAQTVFQDVLVLGPLRLIVPTSHSFVCLLEG